MRTIWKFPLPLTDDPLVEMPVGAEVLSVDTVAPGVLALWASVDPVQPTEPVAFAVRGTGHPLGDVGAFVATVQDPPFVWHVFRGVAS